ncbi:MAG: hypothetical protein OES57_18000 [Acidimicrobiia bacterium]|nr:hypothetical protein [Acidimicrobiia bacterium]
MLSSIHPLGERTRNNRWALTAAGFVLGGVLGGLTTGLVLGAPAELVGRSVDPAVRWAVLAGVAIAAVVLELARRGRALPSWHRQVNEDWLGRYRGWVYGLGFGFQLGAGWLTYVTTPLVYVTAVAAVATGSLTGSMVVCGVFGLTRGVLILAAARVRTPEALRHLHHGLARAAGPVRMLAGATAALTAGIALGALW